MSMNDMAVWSNIKIEKPVWQKNGCCAAGMHKGNMYLGVDIFGLDAKYFQMLEKPEVL